MNFYTYATYTELFDKKIDKCLGEMDEKIDVRYACKVLSIMGYCVREMDETNMYKIFFKLFPTKNISKYRRYLKENVLITKHGVLLAWKKILQLKKEN